MPIDWKKIAMHATYVAGTTFFASLANSYVDSVLTMSEVSSALITAFIAYGTSFFLAYGIISGENNNQTLTSSSVISKSRKGLINICTTRLSRFKHIVFL